MYVVTAASNFSSGDAYAELRVTQSLVEHGTLYEPPSPKCVPGSGYGEPGTDGRCYATHGIGFSLVLVPGYLMARTVIRVFGVPYCGTWDYCVPIHLVSWTGCLLSGLVVSLLCRLCLDLGYGPRRSLAVALLYGFAGLAWPYARFGFDVTPTALCLLAAFREALLGARAPEAPPSLRRWFGAGLYAALALVVRLPSAAALVPLGLFALVAQRRRAWPDGARVVAAFALPLLLAVAWNAWFNLARFGSPFNDGHAHNAADALATDPWVGLFGLIVSPGKGLLWYCPVILLSLALVPRFLRAHRDAAVLAVTMALASMVPYALVHDWYGGAAWGPRFVVPVLPLLILPLAEAPALSARRPLYSFVAWLLASIGVLLALAGQLVDYAERLHLAAQQGVADRIFWDPGHSPIVDHVSTLGHYLTHLGDAAATTGHGAQSFDIWWLNLWRNDQVPKGPSLLAASGVLVLAIIAVCGLLKSLGTAQESEPLQPGVAGASGALVRR